MSIYVEKAIVNVNINQGYSQPVIMRKCSSFTPILFNMHNECTLVCHQRGLKMHIIAQWIIYDIPLPRKTLTCTVHYSADLWMQSL